MSHNNYLWMCMIILRILVMNKIISKKKFSAILLAIITINLLPYRVKAVASETSACIAADACFYSTVDTQSICDPTLGGSAGTGPLYGPLFPKIGDTKQLANSIYAYIKKTKPNSPYNSQAYADMFVAKGITYDVNPALAVAQLQVETSLGTTGHSAPPQYNPFNVRNGPNNSFGSYASYEDAMEQYYSLIKRVYTGPPRSLTSVQEIINIYAPPTDGNNVSAYFSTVNQVMTKILGGLKTTADDTTTQTNQPTPTTTTSSCSNSSAGELGWNITGNNKMVTYNQTDPKYANHPYGKGKSSILESGCGPTSLAMIVATLSGKTNITPITIADKYGDKYHGEGGSLWSLFPVVAKDYDLKFEDLNKDLSRVPAIIKNGGLVLISVDTGYFTPQSHLMVIRAVTEDGTGFYLNDPNGDGWGLHATETKAFDAKFLNGEGALKHLWGYSKK